MSRSLFYYYEGSNDTSFKVENGIRTCADGEDIPAKHCDKHGCPKYRPGDVIRIGDKYYLRDSKIEAKVENLRKQLYSEPNP